jgi:hypothetical protein
MEKPKQKIDPETIKQIKKDKEKQIKENQTIQK